MIDRKEGDQGEGFLGRWIKRKAVARDLREQDSPQPGADGNERDDAQRGSETPDQAAQKKPADESVPAFDLSKLPSLDDITADTNLSDFMRREVPSALRNAALKRAWALDPAIRDYVNPAREYAYDWNAPGGVPGNGPLEAGFDALKQVAQSLRTPAPDHTLGAGEVTGVEISPDAASAKDEVEPPSPVRIAARVEPRQSTQNTETKDETSEPEVRQTAASDIGRSRRRHGGAAPT